MQVEFDLAMSLIGIDDQQEKERIFDALHEAMNGTDRFYHNFDHAWQVFSEVWPLAQQLMKAEDTRLQGQALVLSSLCHDLVVVSGAKDNEEKSCQMMDELFPMVDSKVRKEAKRQIMLTKIHKTSFSDQIGWALVCADVSILGTSRDVYEDYVARVRKEYAFLTDEEWRDGRSAFLKTLLARKKESQWSDDYLCVNAQAWLNIESELDALKNN